MKKLTTTLISLLALTLTGCEKPTQAQIDRYMTNKAIEFDYKGRHYIMFRDGCNNNSVGGVVHSPDCPCHKDDHVKLD